MDTVEPVVEPQLETDPVILRRIFPAEVTLAGRVFYPALAIVTRERVYAWTSPSTPVLSESYTRQDGSPEMPREYELRRRPIVLDIPGGQVAINRGKGCGCGNALKHYRPFQPARSADR